VTGGKNGRATWANIMTFMALPGLFSFRNESSEVILLPYLLKLSRLRRSGMFQLCL